MVIAEEKTISNSCKNPDDFPLFGNSLCISRMLYTGLFLTNIILSGITFLLLIGLLLFFYIRRLAWSNSNYHNNHKSDILHNDGDDDSLSPILPVSRKKRHISNVLTNIITTSSHDDLNERCYHHNFTIPTLESSLSDPNNTSTLITRESNKISSKF